MPMMRRYVCLMVMLGCLPLTGCMDPIELTTEGIRPDYLPRGEQLEELVGRSEEEIRAEVGEPDEIYRAPPVTYWLYRGSGPGSVVAFFPLFPAPLPGPSGGATLHCDLLRFDDGVLQSVALDSSISASSCVELFSTDPEFEAARASEASILKLELRTSARAGDTAAAIRLARTYGELDELRALAGDHDVEAAVELGTRFGETEPLIALNPASLQKLEPDLAYKLYKVLGSAIQPGTESAAWGLLCRAADSGLYGARQSVAEWYRVDRSRERIAENRYWVARAGVQPDMRLAYLWYTLAERSGSGYSRYALESISRTMTAAEMAEAEMLVGEWKPGDCARPLADA